MLYYKLKTSELTCKMISQFRKDCWSIRCSGRSWKWCSRRMCTCTRPNRLPVSRSSADSFTLHTTVKWPSLSLTDSVSFTTNNSENDSTRSRSGRCLNWWVQVNDAHPCTYVQLHQLIINKLWTVMHFLLLFLLFFKIILLRVVPKLHPLAEMRLW